MGRWGRGMWIVFVLFLFLFVRLVFLFLRHVPVVEVVELAAGDGTPVYTNRFIGDELEQCLRERWDVKVESRSALREWHDARPFTPLPARLAPAVTNPVVGARFLIVVRKLPDAQGERATATLLECESGNTLAEWSTSSIVGGQTGSLGIADAFSADIAKKIKDFRHRRDMKTAAVLAIMNKGDQKQLDEWAVGLGRRLAQAAEKTKKVRYLERAHPVLTRFETDLQVFGNPAFASVPPARHADAAAVVEYRLEAGEGKPFDEMPLTLTLRIMPWKGGERVRERRGFAGDRDRLADLLAQDWIEELDAVPAANQDSPEQRKREAANLLAAATAENGPGESDRIRMLDQALRLDPSLTEGYYWFGFYASEPLRYRQGNGLILSRHLGSLLWYIRNTPLDGKNHPTSHASVGVSRTTGALREKAWRMFLHYYGALGADRDGMEPEPGPPDAIPPLGSDFVGLLKAYMSEKPPKNMPDGLYYQGGYNSKDLAVFTNWFLFVNSVYGKDHDGFNVRCPFGIIAERYDSFGLKDESAAMRERAAKEHGHGSPALPAEAVSKAAEPVVMPSDWVELAELDGTNVGPELGWFSMYSGQEGPAPPVPEGVVSREKSPGSPHWVRARGGDSEWQYYFLTDTREVWSGLATAGHSYSFRSLIALGKNGELVEIPAARNGKNARVTVILPVCGKAWVGAYEGLGCYDPGSREWRWLEGSNGVPKGPIMAGTAGLGLLWFAVQTEEKRATVFSLDPGSGRIRVFPLTKPMQEIEGLCILGQNLLIRSGWTRTHLFDPKTGSSRPLASILTTDVVPAAGSFWSGTQRGLAKVREDGTVTELFCHPDPVKEADYQRVLQTYPVLPSNCPLPGPVNALATDGDRLWLTCRKSLLVYEPEHDLWLGPVGLPYGVAWILPEGDSFYMGPYRSAHFDDGGGSRNPVFTAAVVHRDAFIKATDRAGARMTTGEYRDLMERRAAADPLLGGLWRLRQGNALEAAARFDERIRQQPEKPLAYFLKAYALETANPSRALEAADVYRSVAERAGEKGAKELADALRLQCLRRVPR